MPLLLERVSQSVQSLNHVNSLWPHGLHHARLPCPSPTPGAHSNSRPSDPWCNPTISSPVVPFSSCLQSQHQGLFQWVSSMHQVVKVLEFQLQHQNSKAYLKKFASLFCGLRAAPQFPSLVIISCFFFQRYSMQTQASTQTHILSFSVCHLC